MTSAALIYAAAGHPPGYPEDAAGRCVACGLDSNGAPFADWVRPTFTDFDKLLPGEIVCPACQFSFDDHVEELRRRAAKEKLQRMRNYSHFVVEGEWRPLTKGQKAEMLELLALDPQVAVIADSGQKHLIFRAAPGWWQFEELRLRPDPAALDEAAGVAAALLALGFSKGEIERGDYAPQRIRKAGLTAWRELEEQARPHRGSPVFALAVWLAQAPAPTEQEETPIDRPATGRPRPAADLGGRRPGLQGSLFADDLEAV